MRNPARGHRHYESAAMFLWSRMSKTFICIQCQPLGKLRPASFYLVFLTAPRLCHFRLPVNSLASPARPVITGFRKINSRFPLFESARASLVCPLLGYKCGLRRHLKARESVRRPPQRRQRLVIQFKQHSVILRQNAAVGGHAKLKTRGYEYVEGHQHLPSKLPSPTARQGLVTGYEINITGVDYRMRVTCWVLDSWRYQ